MVLQRDTPARVWGTSADTVTVVVDGPDPETAVAQPNPNTGEWHIDLKARKATTKPSTLTFSSQSQNDIVLTDILFGDVWGCHGQVYLIFFRPISIFLLYSLIWSLDWGKISTRL